MTDHAEKIIAAVFALQNALRNAGIDKGLQSITLMSSEDLDHLGAVMKQSRSFAAAWVADTKGEEKTSIAGIPFFAANKTYTPPILKGRRR